ncbi:MAG: DUF2752 domain-containing protein [Clostridiales bacterium]|nr:DUF2752 domain-containing protein [Clostridiales bacterium]
MIIAAYFYAANRLFGYVCPSQVFIGLPCPGCGLTRAALLLSRGDLWGSLRMNTMLPFIPPYLVLALYKRKAADYYLVTLVIMSFVVFGWRFIHSFGIEPMVFNRNNVIRLTLRIFAGRL